MLPFENLFIQGQKLFIQTQILLLLEQLYRVEQIRQGTGYHRP